MSSSTGRGLHSGWLDNKRRRKLDIGFDEFQDRMHKTALAISEYMLPKQSSKTVLGTSNPQMIGEYGFPSSNQRGIDHPAVNGTTGFQTTTLSRDVGSHGSCDDHPVAVERIEDKKEPVGARHAQVVQDLVSESSISLNERSASSASLSSVEICALKPVNGTIDLKLAAALAGLDHMYYTLLDEKVYTDYSGDHLFLTRTMFVASEGLIHDVARRYFEDMLVRWITTWASKIGDPERILDDVEALHVIHQLRTPAGILYKRMYGHDRSGGIRTVAASVTSDAKGLAQLADSSTAPELFDRNRRRQLLSGSDGFLYGRPRLHNLLAWQDIEKRDFGDMSDIYPDNLAEESVLRKYGHSDRKRGRRGEEPSSTEASVNNVDRSSESDIEDDGRERVRRQHTAGGKETLRIGSQTLEINWNDMCYRVSQALNFKTLNDIIGGRIPHNELPLTPKNYCTHCGLDHIKSRTPLMCAGCNHVMKQNVDYATLCDALVFAYIFDDIGIDLVCGTEQLTLPDVVKLLPLARCYQRIDELGKDTFKWQCYFITHVIYVFSDWGQHGLSRQLFSEEFEFLIGNMDLAIRLNDPELVGEFLQCLKLLGVDEWQDEDIWHVISSGTEYLVKLEQSLGGKGRWITSRSPKDQYHTSYCASIGLQNYHFLSSATTDSSLPIPRVVQLLREQSNS